MIGFNLYDKNIYSFPDKITRKRTDSLLTSALSKSFVMVSASRGFGKTLIVSDFLKRNSYTPNWVKIQKLDNIASRFWKNFIDSMFPNDLALNQRFISLGFPTTLSSFDRFLHMFSETIDATQKQIIVFDDLYYIEENDVLEFIQKFSIAQLFNVTLIVILRKIENPIFSRLKTKDFVYEIVEEDLRFTNPEISDFFLNNGFSIKPEDMKEICVYTGGWTFALQLIAMSFLQNENVLNDLSISSAKADILQLVEKELFAPCSYQMQNLLIKLSLFENIPLGLLSEISSDYPIAAKEIVQNSLFMYAEPFSADYKIYSIFLDYLKQKQTLLFDYEVVELKSKAGRWYEQNGYTIDAINCFQQISSYSNVLDIIIEQKSRCPSKLVNLYVQALDAFPDSFVAQNPIVYAVRGRCLLNNGSIREVYGYLSIKRALLESSLALEQNESRSVVIKEALGEIFILLALLSGTLRIVDFVDLFKLADFFLPNGSKLIDQTTEIVRGNIVTLAGAPKRGQIKFAVDMFFEAISCATKVMNGCGMGIEYLAATEMTFYMNDLKNAEKSAYQSIYKAQQAEQHDVEIMAYFFLIRIAIAKGQYFKANEFVDLLKNKANGVLNTVSFEIIDIALSWFYVALNDVESANKWIIDENDENAENVEIEEPSPLMIGLDTLVKARCLLAKKEYYKLLVLFEDIGAYYDMDIFLISMVEVEILKSICYFNIGEIKKSSACFLKAYNLSYENDLTMSFLEYGNHIKPIILAQKGSTKIPKTWLDKINLEASSYAKHLYFSIEEHNNIHFKQTTKVPTLTKQEMEILLNICNGFSKEQLAISSKLPLKIVKIIIKIIYEKLEVTNNIEAIQAATSLDIFKQNLS